MDEKIKKYLADILESIDAINEYLHGKKDFNIYLQSKIIRRSVEREIEIIGEAVNRLLKKHPEIAITSAKKIIDQRNLIIHAYDSINNEMIWAVVVNHLPLLKIECEQLLAHDNK
jgi:uncharacterized protein with HEPN domain